MTACNFNCISPHVPVDAMAVNVSLLSFVHVIRHDPPVMPTDDVVLSMLFPYTIPV